MALPAAHHPCWHQLASGALSKFKTQHLGTPLLVKRIERSSDPVDEKAKGKQAFFAKRERALPAEVQQLTIV